MEVHVHRHRQAGDTAIGMPCRRTLVFECLQSLPGRQHDVPGFQSYRGQSQLAQGAGSRTAPWPRRFRNHARCRPGAYLPVLWV